MPASQRDLPDPVLRERDGKTRATFSTAELASEGGSGADMMQSARAQGPEASHHYGASGLLFWFVAIAIVGLLFALWFGSSVFQAV